MAKKDIVKKEFIAKGTTCESCAKIIKRQALKVEGVRDIWFDYSTEKGEVSFDSDKTNIEEIFKAIEEKGYTCSLIENKGEVLSEEPEYYYLNKKIIGTVFGIVGILVVGYFLFNFVEGVNLPEISQNMGYGLLFVVGLLTGIHCVSMCGGFVVSYTAKHAQEGTKSHKSHLMYGLGKTISYTVIGAIFGLLGSIIAFTPTMRGVAGLLAGLFLILFGLKMLNIIPILRKIQFRTPKFISKLVGRKSEKNSSPLIIGLLNGLMIACGPLQAIYIMAAGTGNMLEGAKLLFIFALGTLPVMLGFGYLTSFVSSKVTHKILKVSGAIVIILGLVMMNNGLVLTGTGYDFKSMVDSVSGANSITANAVASDSIASIKGGFQEIRMEVNRYGWEPDKFVLKKGVPVRWIINGKEINGCNNAIQVPKFGLDFDIKRGEQIIEFTPNQEGMIRWSCWMGMIQGVFIVKEDIDLSNQNAVKEELDAVPELEGGSCGGGSGGCGCGGGR